MYVLYKRNGAYWVATSEIYNKDTCYLSSPVAWYESDNSCWEESSNYINNPNAIFGYARSCMKWTPTVKCEQLVDSWSPTSVSTTKCDNVLSSKPMTCTSTSSWWWPGGAWWGSSSDNWCNIKSNSTYFNWCKAAYHWWSMVGEANAVVNNNGVRNISDASNPAWLTNYCKKQTTKSACEAVWVAHHQPSSYTVRYWGVILPYNNTNFPVDTAACCEWGW